MRRLVALASLMLACGDDLTPRGVGLAQTADLVVVAHVSDDLLFMQPDTLELAQRGGLTVVYLRGGLRGDDGVLAAYSHATGSDAWTCGVITIAEQTAFHCRLAEQNLSLVFFDTPDYAALLRIVLETDPTTLRTLEISNTHGVDDQQHADAGRRAIVALAETKTNVDLIAYRGTGTVDEPPNKLTSVYDATVGMLSRYEACATGCAACGDACTAIDQTAVDWLLRRYAVGFRRGGAGGRLRSGNECLDSDLSMMSCTSAPIWTLDAAGQLRAGETEFCLAVGPGGQLTVAKCLGGVDLRWFLDDDGHILSAAGQVRCLTPRNGAARLELCDASNNPTWELVPETNITSRATLGLAATGRDVRLADVTGEHWADLCAIEGDGLWCARGTGTGEFRPAVRIDNPFAPLAIEPRSLAFGDIDGDGREDACGRDAAGIVCATAAADFNAARFSTEFSDATATAATAASLTVLDADGDGLDEVCGVDQLGLLCVNSGGSFTRGGPPAINDTVFFGELDGDSQADWCAATGTGPMCAVWAEQTLTSDAAPWGYSEGGVVEITPATSSTVGIADIDRDGRGDLCTLRDDRVLCARSQGRAFGPRLTLAILPNQAVASALWLGDLDGDGRADACVDSGSAIVCARQP